MITMPSFIVRAQGLIMRWRFNRAYAKDLDRESGTILDRQGIVRRFNAGRFWWQREREPLKGPHCRACARDDERWLT